MSQKTKLYLLTGFLGSGKTTFLLNMLDRLTDKKVAVIQNEFGKIGVDGPIIERDGMELMEINRGSIFCSCLQLTFVQALIEMAERKMDYVIVESSGLADPSNIVQFLDAVEANKGDVYDYSGAICLVDGVNFLEQVEDIETVERQLRFCHLVILSKVDLIEETQLAKVKEKIRKINPKVDIVESILGKSDYDYLGKNLIEKGWMDSEDTTNTPENKPKTLSLTYDGDLSKDQLVDFIERVKGDCFRIKGFMKLDDEWNQIDVVNRLVDFKPTEEKDSSQIVLISKIGTKIIKPIFDAWDEAVGEKMTLR